MRSTTLGGQPRSATYWVRVFFMILALAGIVYSIDYFNSGRFSEDTSVQSFMNNERKARVVVQPGSVPAAKPSAPAPSDTENH